MTVYKQTRPGYVREPTFALDRHPVTSRRSESPPCNCNQVDMAPKPASTAGKAPASTASKAPAKTTSEGSKVAKKATKPAAGSGDDGKKRRRKTRKETYSSYIYKGTHLDASG